MKTVILYESKHGTTEKCATYIKDKHNIQDIMKISEFNGKISDYERIIIGTPVYIGQINKKVKAFIELNQDILFGKEVMIFICGMNDENYEQMLTMNFSEDMIKHARIIHVGGAYDFHKLGFFNKFIVKKIAKVNHSIERIKYDQLDLI